ncbi:MAG: hypothetical protein ACPHL6_00700 [Rubripirellula sp.]
MDADKIKNFFLNHCEKMILTLVILGSGYMIYAGSQKPNFLETEQPDRLADSATKVKSDVDLDHNENIIPDRVPTFDIVRQTARLDTAVDPLDYSLPKTWSGKSPNSIVRRLDPELLPPESLIVQSVVTAIAIRGSRTEPDAYTLASLENADPVEKVEKPKRRERRSRGRGGEEMDMEMSGMDDMMMEMGGMEDMMMEMGEGGLGGASGPNRSFNNEHDLGMRPVATQDKANPEPAVGWFIAGSAVVPHRQLYEAYKQAFQDADQYDPRRDTPFYYDLQVQRADVTDKSADQLVEADWAKVWDRTLYTKLAAYNWSGFAPEIVPSDYRDEALTMWLPPVLLDDYRSIALHPLVPKLSQDAIKREQGSIEEDTDIKEFSMEMDDDAELVAPGERSSSSFGGGDDMYGDMDMGGMDMDMEGGMMMGMGMAMMGRGALEEDPVDYKLIRFYDFAGFKNSPKFGRKYVYRIRYAVNDPNFPFAETLQPKVSSLAPDVATRVQDLMTTALKDGKRSFRRWSDWSQPTEPVSLPTLEQYFAGPIDRGGVSKWKVAGKDVEYSRDAPKAKILASQYDLKTGARIPMQIDATEGTVLSKKMESADVVDPITLTVKKLPDAELISGTTIVDLEGGLPLAITEELTTPGMMLLFDQSGQLMVADEVTDQQMFRTYTYAEERGE